MVRGGELTSVLPTLRYIVLVARRDRLFAALCLAILLAAGLSAVLGSAALVEQTEMALSFTGAAARLILVLGLAVFVPFSLHRLIETGELSLILSRPLTRTRFVLGAGLGYGLVAAVLVVPAWAVVWLVGPPPVTGFVVWGASLLLEMTLVVGAALFFGLSLSSSVASTIAVLAFYVLARMAPFLVGILDADWSANAGVFGQGIEMVMIGIAAVMPRVDLFARTDWLVHDATFDRAVWVMLLQWLVYLPLLLAATAFDFRRRQF